MAFQHRRSFAQHKKKSPNFRVSDYLGDFYLVE
nr:MAG TPA: hypothetical protein [Caudoviricetes sp.]